MILYSTKFLTLKAAKREGKPDWYYVVRANSKNVVAILPLIKSGAHAEILFLITKRPPLIEEKTAEFCVELPAGLVGDEDKNETIEDAIKKELLEETGLVASSFEIAANKVSSSSGLTNETTVIAIANIEDKNIKSAPIDDGGIIHSRVYVQEDKILEFLNECQQKGYAISGAALSAICYLKLRSE